MDTIVRITNDCPCMDPRVIDNVILDFETTNCDYVSNTLVRTYPHGMDVEVFSMAALEKSHKHAKAKYDREHVTPYIYSTAKELFKTENVESEKKYHSPDIRITLDRIEDYALICCVYEFLYNRILIFHWMKSYHYSVINHG